MTVQDRIEISPKIMVGKPVIRGTRIPVELTVRKLSEGADEKIVLQAYPRLTVEAIRAADPLRRRPQGHGQRRQHDEVSDARTASGKALARSLAIPWQANPPLSRLSRRPTMGSMFSSAEGPDYLIEPLT